HRVLRIHAAPPRLQNERPEPVGRRGDILAFDRPRPANARVDALRIARADPAALGNLPGEPRELGEDDRALERIHAPADAEARMDVALALAVDADLAEGARQLVVA